LPQEEQRQHWEKARHGVKVKSEMEWSVNEHNVVLNCEMGEVNNELNEK